MNATVRRWLLLLIVALTSLNVGTVTAWITCSSGETPLHAVQSAAVAFGSTAALLTAILSALALWGDPGAAGNQGAATS